MLYIFSATFHFVHSIISFVLPVQVGSQRSFGFAIKDHLQLGKELDLFDFDAAAEV